MACPMSSARVFIYKFIWRLTRRHWAAAARDGSVRAEPECAVHAVHADDRAADVRDHDGCRLRAAVLDPGGRQPTGSATFTSLAPGSPPCCARSPVTRAGRSRWRSPAIVLYCSMTRLRLMARLVVTGFVTACVVAAGWGVRRTVGWRGPRSSSRSRSLGYLFLRRLYERNDWDADRGAAHHVRHSRRPWARWPGWRGTGRSSAARWPSRRASTPSPSLWVDSGEKAVHNIVISLRTYEIASVDNLTPVVAIVAVHRASPCSCGGRGYPRSPGRPWPFW